VTDKNRVNVSCKINNKKYSFTTYPMLRLIDILREEVGITDVKEGCGEGECGACMVLIDDLPVNSCLVPAFTIDGCNITTTEGLSGDPHFKSLKKAFISNGGAQCGFCTPGVIISSVALLRKNPDPSREEIMTALSGNLCRCTGYSPIIESIIEAIKDTGSKK